MEIGLKGSIPTFAGGLGVLAADLMRSAADLSLPAACVTVCWKHGYLHQHIRPDGSQDYEDMEWNREKELERLPERVTVKIEGRDVVVGVWVLKLQSHVEGSALSGRGQKARSSAGVPVYFLDTDVPENSPQDRAICDRLYGGDQAMRITQEVVLGFGGVKMLRALGHKDITYFHMNEGHCSFLTLELLRERGFKDDEVRKSCAFTTHTPIKAGHDEFGYDLAYRIVGDGLPWHIKKLAGENALSMTELAMSLSHYTCGVSKVHGQVSSKMFNRPIDSITNGVNHIEWASPEMQELFDELIPNWRKDPLQLLKMSRDIPDDKLWKAHQKAKKKLLTLVNASQGEHPFSEDVLTIASARRVVPYKRPELLYTNLDRLRQVGDGKIQIIHAGNAHPHDQFSMDVIRHMIEQSWELRGCIKIAYLPNYNPDLAKLLVSGADVWLNTPTRLHEASGTSGMKACLNGVLNLSTLDGWWIEGYAMDPEAGWRIGPLASSLSPDDTRQIDAEDLYTQLQYQVIPEYNYEGRARWLRRMKRAIGLMGYFNANRCVLEYWEKAWK
ncbi:alpha-glucan family phosphorylase [Candidatus Peribacteria bacterium]|nr:alpha-glucan family phosphorylase [Candidatus Peribacteria bacterium]